MAVYPAVSERGFFAFAIVSAMGNLVTVATDGEFYASAIKGDFSGQGRSQPGSHWAPPGIYAILTGLLIWPASPLLVWAPM